MRRFTVMGTPCHADLECAPMDDLAGKVAVVTGGASGIGFGMARHSLP